MEVSIIQHSTGRITVVAVSYDDTVARLKEKACTALGVVGRTELRFDGEVLEEEDLVAHGNVASGDRLELRTSYAKVQCPASYDIRADNVALSSSGARCYYGREALYAFNTETGEEIRPIAVRKGHINMMALSQCGDWVYIAADHSLTQHSVDTGVPVRTLADCYTNIVRTTLCGRYVAFSHEFLGELHIHSVEDGMLVKSFENTDNFAVSDDGEWVVTVNREGATVYTMGGEKEEVFVGCVQGRCVAISPCCQRFVVGFHGQQQCLKVFSREGSCLFVSKECFSAFAVQWSPCGKWILSHDVNPNRSSCGHRIRRQDAASGVVVQMLNFAKAFAISPCSRYIFVVEDTTVRVAELEGECVASRPVC